MASPESTITLSIREAGAPDRRSLLLHVLVDGRAVATNQEVAPPAWRALRDLSRRYFDLFESPREPSVAADTLASLGTLLFDLFLAAAWQHVGAAVPPGARRLLLIASDTPEVLNLPWELLRPPGGDFLGFDPRYALRRTPWPDRPLAPFAGPLPPRPLRILFMACSPRGQAPLDFEREEEALRRAIARAGPNVAFDSVDAGTFEELRQRIAEFRPHLVHLTGHGVVKADGLGYFAFEVERGETDSRSSVEIQGQLLAGSGVQGVFVSGCQTGKAPPVAALGGICAGLVGDEVPLALGWAASVADDLATGFAATFYRVVAAGQPVDRALLQARQVTDRLSEHLAIRGLYEELERINLELLAREERPEPKSWIARS